MTSGGRWPNGMIASSRLRNSGVNIRLIASVSSPSRFVPAEADRRLGQVGRARIGGHDQDDVAEVDLLAVVVGQLAVVHHLQQDVEQVRMRLLDLVEQQHAVRMLVDAVGQQAALVEADIAGRRADQPRDRVALHVFRHVEAQQLDAERRGELLGDLGLADAGRAGEQVAADRLLRLAQAGAGQLDRRRRAPRSPCPGRRPRASASFSRCASTSASSFETVFGGMRAMVAMVASISLTPIVFLRLALRQQHLRGARSRRSRRSPCRAACGRGCSAPTARPPP